MTRRDSAEAAGCVQKSHDLQNQETWGLTLSVFECGEVSWNQPPNAFKILLSDLDFILCTGLQPGQTGVLAIV
jgi:hypothetical protein